MNAEIFSNVPNELKTVEIDVEKKIFKVNGESFSRKCTGFSLSCAAGEGFEVRMDVDTTVTLASYNTRGCKTADCSYEKEDLQGSR